MSRFGIFKRMNLYILSLLSFKIRVAVVAYTPENPMEKQFGNGLWLKPSARHYLSANIIVSYICAAHSKCLCARVLAERLG